MPRSQSLYPTERTRRVGALGHTLETIRDAQAEKSNSEDFEKFSENAEHSDNLAHKDSTSFVSLFYHSNPVSKAGISSGIAQSRMRASTTTVGKDSVRIFSCFFRMLGCLEASQGVSCMSYHVVPCRTLHDLTQVSQICGRFRSWGWQLKVCLFLTWRSVTPLESLESLDLAAVLIVQFLFLDELVPPVMQT